MGELFFGRGVRAISLPDIRPQPAIAQTYFSNPEKRTRADIDSSNASLRGTLKSLQVSARASLCGPKFPLFTHLIICALGNP